MTNWPPTPRAVLGDKGYDSKDNRDAAREKGCMPVIPRRSNSKQKGRFFPKKLYKLRAGSSPGRRPCRPRGFQPFTKVAGKV
jgi:IS5 family transposase